MGYESVETKRLIAQLEARNSLEGRFRRYARSRRKAVFKRHMMSAIGALSVAILAGPYWAALGMLLTALGEVIEIYGLAYLVRRLNLGVSFAPLLRISGFIAAVQALTVGGAVTMAWFVMSHEQNAFFCLAFLSAAALNSGVLKSLHPSATLIKLTVFAITGIGCLAVQFIIDGGPAKPLILNAVGAFMLAYMVISFINFSEKSFKRNAKAELDQLRRQRMIEDTASELKEKQKDLRMLSLVARHANDSVMLIGPDKRIVWVNEAFVTAKGFTPSEAIGKSPRDLLRFDETHKKTAELLWENAYAGRAFRCELQNTTKDGREFWVESNAVPVFDENGEMEVLVAVERDITESKRNAEELASARQDAEHSAQVKSQFLATMSHEIRTPMHGIIGMADLLCENDLSREEAEYAATIKASAQALLKIINDILDLSKLDAGKLSIDPVDFAPGRCILDAIDLLRAQAREKGLYLDVNFDTRLPAQVHGDDGRLRQILINLVGNAIKFTELGGVTVNVRHEKIGQTTNLYIAVKDTGIGITEDKIDLVFDHFSQADAAITRRFGGTGLGLSISRLLLEEMGGDISVSSQEGMGSTFSITLPVREPVAETSNAETKLPPVDLEKIRNKRLLLADDNRTNRLIIERYLKNYPLELVSVENGQEAVTAVETEHFDAVLMDMSMPVMDGVEATKRIRATLGESLPIIALTANAFSADRERCFEVGMNDFLSKPVNKGDLLEAIQTAVSPPEILKNQKTAS